MALYQLTLFYSSVTENKTAIQRIRDDVQAIAGEKWRVLSAGEQICAIAFETNKEHTEFHKLFRRSVDQSKIRFLLVQIHEIVDGILPPEIWQWLSNRPSRN
jgi:hypothetical protein